MIYLTRQEYSLHHRGNIIVLKRQTNGCCPICQEKLYVHGTCQRKLRSIERIYTVRLRVMRCGSCGKTHRELPHFLVPYKRYGLNAICEILCSCSGQHPCETSTWLRLKHWLTALIMLFKQKIGSMRYESTMSSSEMANFIVEMISFLIRQNRGNSIAMQSKLSCQLVQ